MIPDLWLILSYTLPNEPSRLRVLAWRHLRKLGAVPLDTGVWLLPFASSLNPKIDAIQTEIVAMGGKANSFVATGAGLFQNKDLREAYNRSRRAEYLELQKMCERFLTHLDRVATAGDPSFSDVEELEQDLEKRQRWFADAVERDIFCIEERGNVEASLRHCEAALATFMELAYVAASNVRVEPDETSSPAEVSTEVPGSQPLKAISKSTRLF